jgi:hypothetical protein
MTNRSGGRDRGGPLPRFRAAIVAALVVASLAACSSDKSSQESGPPTFEGKPPSGFVDMNEVQIAYIGSAGGGTGTLFFDGQNYPFTIGGLGVGGIGISTIDAKGEVYNLARVSDFPGAYGQGRYGAVAGTASEVGDRNAILLQHQPLRQHQQTDCDEKKQRRWNDRQNLMLDLFQQSPHREFRLRSVIDAKVYMSKVVSYTPFELPLVGFETFVVDQLAGKF